MITMATSCLGCGNSAVRRSRVPANDVAYVLRRYLGQRCKEDNAEIDIEQLLSQSWVFRTCAKAYHTHEMKDKCLYAATANSVSALTSQPHADTFCSIGTKRCSDTEFPSVNKRVCSTRVKYSFLDCIYVQTLVCKNYNSIRHVMDIKLKLRSFLLLLKVLVMNINIRRSYNLPKELSQNIIVRPLRSIVGQK